MNRVEVCLMLADAMEPALSAEGSRLLSRLVLGSFVTVVGGAVLFRLIVRLSSRTGR